MTGRIGLHENGKFTSDIGKTIPQQYKQTYNLDIMQHFHTHVTVKQGTSTIRKLHSIIFVTPRK